MDRKELIAILEMAQNGDTIAEDKLLVEIRDNIMNRRLGRYLYKNRQVDNDDIRQEFMLGVALNIHRAKLDVGDPIEYLIAQGVYRAKSYFRGQVLKNVNMTCEECGYTSRIHKVNGEYTCRKCGSHNITTQEIHNLDDGLQLNQITDESIDDFEAELTFNTIMEQFEKTLNQNTNIYQLYILIKNGINRENPDIKNYIKEIATMWRCSQTNILQIMHKLQQKLIEFADENGMEIVNNRFVVKENRHGSN